MSGTKIPKQINVAKLKQPDVCQELSDAFDNMHFDGTWENFKEQVCRTGLNILGKEVKKHRKWFDENDENICKLR